ncbi:MAG TPA: branched-chain amino acid ABC transporter permease, partial [Ramlibacter sp.]
MSNVESAILQLISGLATGTIYATVALALVMIYQATRLINFAQGEMATASTYGAWALLQAGVPYWPAFLLTVVASFIGGAVIERAIVRPMSGRSHLSIVVLFIGLMVICNSVVSLAWGFETREFPSPFAGLIPANPYFSSHQVGAALVCAALILLLFAFFRFTSLGLALRAA